MENPGKPPPTDGEVEEALVRITERIMEQLPSNWIFGLFLAPVRQVDDGVLGEALLLSNASEGMMVSLVEQWLESLKKRRTH